MTARLFAYLGWSIVLLASAYFVYINALHYFFQYNQQSFDDFWPGYAPWLLLHITGGLIALIIGPFQFISSIRKNYTHIHRFMGKTYLISILIGGLASLILSIDKMLIHEKAYTFGGGLVGLAVAWLTCSAMAYWAVRSKNFVQHREWMVRSYVVTCAFTSFRLIFRLLVEKFHVDPGQTAGLMAWACWAAPLFVTEVILQARKIHKGNIALAAKQKA
ncbi:MAG: DUF2306 domain-containing protein [Sphingobacteriales bacterium]|nr:DUF2306 domain-containing protein [Sphingobacteriales bacterium]